MSNLRFCIIEDDPYYRKLLSHVYALNPEAEVVAYASVEEMLGKETKPPYLISIDYHLPGTNGLDAMPKLLKRYPSARIVMVSEQSEVHVAVEAMKSGAFDYVTKGDDLRERLLAVLHHLQRETSLDQKVEALQRVAQSAFDVSVDAGDDKILGESDAIKQITGLIRKAAATDIVVSITGETGTGKELVAKAVHFSGPRASEPFIAVNMAAVPHELAESELFGHEKGAFTGAVARRIGKFEQAGRGTLFLDEIGEMPATLQSKLLRVIQEMEVVRVGGTTSTKLECRIVVATNRDLAQEVQTGRFREDLYFRLLGLPIELPPLRARGNDMLILAKSFADDFAKRNGMPPPELSNEARKVLLEYHWPGNIRELKAVIELAVVLNEDGLIHASHLRLSTPMLRKSVVDPNRTLKEINEDIIRERLKQHGNNVRKVADELDIGKSTIYRLLQEWEEPNSGTPD